MQISVIHPVIDILKFVQNIIFKLRHFGFRNIVIRSINVYLIKLFDCMFDIKTFG